ncbi:hypothetical protein [Photobacterium alginatilyticum]|uniref:Uncharacterized protein n=1 Tax=Photobacterium alginatilyticum TaxID=1775171 RepID=A0ABW9YFR4_9GAMM|nr:hypothetical protein [Photobacterium alginatilyticum]NBI52513.1 hypothetical protein [Photobacterium alginatilyticum]
MNQDKSAIQDDSGQDKKSAGNAVARPEAEGRSRFSRRRFLHTSAAISPVLFSLKSHAGWGSGAGGQNCSIMVSGNASDPQLCSNDAVGPERWSQVIRSRQGESTYPLRQALNNSQISGSTYFNQLFLNPFYHWQNVPLKGWKFKLSVQQSSDVRIKHVLGAHGGGQFRLALTFEPTESGASGETTEVALRPRHFHQVLVAAYLNAFFSSSVIRYPYNTRQVESAVIEMIMVLASKLADELNTHGSVDERSPAVKKAFTDIISQLRMWS